MLSCTNLQLSAYSAAEEGFSMGEECCFKGRQREVGQGKHFAHVGDKQLDVGGWVARAAGGVLQLGVHESLQWGQGRECLSIVSRLVALHHTGGACLIVGARKCWWDSHGVRRWYTVRGQHRMSIWLLLDKGREVLSISLLLL